MVLRNCENKKYRGKIERKAYKIEGKRLVLVGKRYYDLSLSDEITLRKPLFIRVASKNV